VTIEKMMDKMKDIVEDTLAISKEARNDDKRLIWEILVSRYDLTISFEEFSKFPMFESIRRCRQKIQSEGKFRPTNKTFG